jgi:hypothetical protein
MYCAFVLWDILMAKIFLQIMIFSFYLLLFLWFSFSGSLFFFVVVVVVLAFELRAYYLLGKHSIT